MIFPLFLAARRVFKSGLKVAYDYVNSAAGSIGFLQEDGSEVKLSLDSEGLKVDGLPSGVQAAVFELEAAEVQDLNSNPFEVVAAPGAGKFVLVEGVLIRHEGSGATAHANGGDCELRYTNGAGTALTGSLSVAGFWDQTDDEVRYLAGTAGVSSAFTPTENAAVVLNMQTGDLDTGNAKAEVVVFYRILDSDNVA